MRKIARLQHRSVFFVAGADRAPFLQGLMTNDIYQAAERQALYAALLTPQGKFLYDLFIYNDGDHYIIDSQADQRDDLLKKLALHKLRADITLTPVDDLAVVQLPEGGEGGGVMFADPRLKEAGSRGYLKEEQINNFQEMSFDEYDQWRIRLGLPEGARDLPFGQAIVLENGFEELNAMNWDKGCYLGQELMARTKHRGEVRKKLVPVQIDGPAPPFDASLTVGGKRAGKMRSSNGNVGLALVRLDFLGEALEYEGSFLKPAA